LRRGASSVWSAIFATIALRLGAILWLSPPASWDGAIYTRLAEGLARGHGYVHWGGTGRPTAFFPAGFPGAIAAVMTVTGASATVAAWAVNVVSSALTTVAAAAIGRALDQERGARRAAWTFALYPAMILWSAAAMTETLQCAWITVAFALAIGQPRAPSPFARAVLLGIATGLATLVRPQGILLAPLLGALCDSRSITARAKSAVIALVTTLALVSPWSLRNAQTLDGPALVSTNGGSNLLIGTLPEARGGYRELTARDACATVSGEVHRDRCMSRAAIERIARAPGSWALLAARKIARTVGFEWAPISYARSVVPERIPRWIGIVLALVCTACWWATLVMSARFVLRERRSDAALAVVGSFFAVVLVHAAFIADDRYHLVLVGPLCAIAANARRARTKG
jgi:4-amino-4-deoxy-L-arabinose transferase-like glycosyltransferase